MMTTTTMNWRGVLMFALALVCATSALVAAGLAEGAMDPAPVAGASGAVSR